MVKAILKSGTPLNRSEYFQDVFEEKGYSLNPQSNTRQLVPFILEEELKLVAKEVMGKELSIIFDGTDGETLVVLVSFVEDWKLKVRLIRFQIVKSSVGGA